MVPPKMITYYGKIITSMCSIANIANSHYINKISNIRKLFTPSDISPINILEK